MIMGAWGLGRKPKLPYDAEVEYLESTGTQWIDTGVAGVEGLHITTKITPLSPVATSYQDFFGGSNGNNTSGYRARTQDTNIGLMSVCVGSKAWNNVDVSTVPVTIDIDSALTVNGTKQSGVARSSYPGQNLYLFAFNNNGSVYRRSNIRCFYFTVEGIMDLIPVRFTNEQGVSEGAMYDRANPTVGMNPDGSPRTDGLYRNRGTGAFLWAEKQ